MALCALARCAPQQLRAPTSVAAPLQRLDPTLASVANSTLALRVRVAGADLQAQIAAEITRNTRQVTPELLAEPSAELTPELALIGQFHEREASSGSEVDAVETLRWVELSPGIRARLKGSRGDPEVTFVDGEVHVRLPIYFSAATAITRGRKSVAVYQCGCGGQTWCGAQDEAPREVIAHWRFPMAQGDAWSLAPQASHTYALEGEVSCSLPLRPGAPKLDVAQVVREGLKELELGGVEGFKQGLAGYNGVEERLQALWKELETPRPAEPKVGPWLWLRPKGLTWRSFAIEEQDIALDVQVALNPVLVDTLPDAGPPTLPWPPPPFKGEPGFRVAAKFSLPLEDLAKPLADRFVGRRFPDRASRHIRVTAVNVYGADDGRVSLAMTLDGSATGTIYWRGRLKTQAEPPRLIIGKLALSEKSSAALDLLFDEYERFDARVRQVPWVDQDALTAEVAEAAVFPIEAALAKARTDKQAALKERLPGSTGALAIDIKRTSFLSGLMDKEATRVLFLLEGQAEWQPDAPSGPKANTESPAE